MTPAGPFPTCQKLSTEHGAELEDNSADIEVGHTDLRVPAAEPLPG
jgi:hypothetical protein